MSLNNSNLFNSKSQDKNPSSDNVVQYKPSKKFKSFIWSNKDFSDSELLNQIIKMNDVRPKTDLDFRIGFEIYNSNKIEGNKLDRIETRLILEDKIIPEDSSYRDIMECINLGTTIEDFRLIDSLSLDLILNIHKSVTNNILGKDQKGKIRTGPVYITNSMHIPPKPSEVESLLIDSINKFNNSDKNIIDVFIFKFELVSIHPFIDGNGRTSRVIMNGLLENLGFPRLIITDKEKKFYYEALENSNTRFNKNYWIRYCLLLMKYNLEFLDCVDYLD